MLCSSSLAAAGVALRAPNCSLQHPSKPQREPGLSRPWQPALCCRMLLEACSALFSGWAGCAGKSESTVTSPPAHPGNASACPFSPRNLVLQVLFLVEMRYEGCSDSCPSTCSWSEPGGTPVPIHTLNLAAAGLCCRQIFHVTCSHPALPQPGISSGECR